ncbi:MAG: hypothetical protein A2Y82_04125 [Candidatus Buchananbacteria bacterium RBG_13_36_9]|uniref:Uncharacterized protein n=1 Tax=Candidatus Buchananbacteria bacterium RBG_13_36_9 TaxID=1797530 RepID=A0A1G1XR00_9BACT|nr:MAG: hypothetical protein A2Y82_04125 [Candidatus Buchananbacteria bacterium RBG_13_36_9]
MKNENFRIYGIILLVIAGFMILRNYYLFYWEWMYEFSKVINWVIIVACAFIGFRIMGHQCDK